MKLLHRVKVREVHITYNSNFTAVTKFLLSLVAYICQNYSLTYTTFLR